MSRLSLRERKTLASRNCNSSFGSEAFPFAERKATIQPMSRSQRRWLFLPVAIVSLAAIGIGWWWSQKHRRPDRPSDTQPLSFDGTSDQLRQTVVLPTLDTPIPEGKSAIWCASFQLAWNRLKDDVAKEPIRLANAQEIADRLNRGDQTEDDLDPQSVYAAAGLMRDGIADRIRGDMARKFPNVPGPQFDVPPDGAVAYAYLEASAKFDIPFFENDEPFEFTDSAGNKTAVGSFGIRKKDDYAYHKLRAQVQILFRRDDERGLEEIPEFIVDPCARSQPYQIMLARIDRKPTLAETFADAETRIGTNPPREFGSKLRPRDTLVVPNIVSQITHRYKELEGTDKQFSNRELRGLHLDTAMQVIRFRLDRSGAELASESKVYVKPSASYFHLDHPFLIIMKKRDAKRPFFVMWVDNAELLQKK